MPDRPAPRDLGRPPLPSLTALRLAWLYHQLDLRDFDRVPVAVGDLMLEIAEPMAVPGRLRWMLMLERFLQPMPVVCVTIGPLGPVGHDDVGVTVGVFTMCPMRVLDHLDEPVDMRIRTKIVAVNVLVIVPVRHKPMLQGDARSGQAAAGQ